MSASGQSTRASRLLALVHTLSGDDAVKYLNLTDALVIGFSAYVMIYGINYFLRAGGLSAYQA